MDAEFEQFGLDEREAAIAIAVLAVVEARQNQRIIVALQAHDQRIPEGVQQAVAAKISSAIGGYSAWMDNPDPRTRPFPQPDSSDTPDPEVSS